MQIIFQDPFASLNPRMTVGSIIGEALVVHGLVKDSREFEAKVVELLEAVDSNSRLHESLPARVLRRPAAADRHRAGAGGVSPKLIVCDEPVSALDVSIQAQVINLLEDLQGKFNLTYLFIAHDLSVVEHISDRVAVMYLGRIVEIAPARELYKNPLHPYTEALLAAVPVPDPSFKRERVVLEGDVPNPVRPPPGCHFHTRCPIRQLSALQEVSPPLEKSNEGHWVACHFRGK